MALEQVRFLGASITSFNSVVGWNGQASTVEVSLVEDLRNGDSFEPPTVGSPVFFQYEGFRFGGILQNVSKSGSSGGSPLYTATIVDPRILLNGVRVILGDYSGSVGGVPNLVNAYGFYEFYLFGSSGSNGGGMTWDRIRTALNGTIAGATYGMFGGPIRYQGYNYTINLSNLPNLPSYFRLSGSMSLMDIIQQVCDAGGCDFFCELIGTTITFFTISRLVVPDQGVITTFISQTPGAVSKQIGFDMVNEVTGKLVVGGKVRQMYYQYYGSNDVSDGVNNPIWFFWGFDLDGNPVMGDGLDDSHTFVLDSRNVLIQGVQDTYPTSIGEMRSALASYDEWHDFLVRNNNLPTIPDPNGNNSDTAVPLTGADGYKLSRIQGFYNYASSGKNNPHFQKALALGLQDPYQANSVFFINGNQAGTGQLDFGRMRQIFPGVIEDETEKLYDMIRRIAEDNYGTRIMVALPQNIRVAYDAENNKPIFSMEPCDGAYLDESLLTNALGSNLIPPDLNAVTDDMNLFKPMVRYDNIGILDFSHVDEDQMFYSADGNSIFILCTIDSEVFFDTAGQPRVVLRIPGRVTFANPFITSLGATATYLRAAVSNTGLSQTEQEEFELRLASYYPPASELQFAALPAMAAVPMESNVDRYGPWFAQGSVGAIDFEENESLTPWNYGTYLNMNLAGNAMVTQNISNLQTIESGSIEFPGVPAHNLGAQLLSTGPYISNIQVSIGNDGVKTSYRMEMWKPKFGALNREYADMIEKSGKLYNNLRRNFLEKIKINRKVK